MKTISGLGERVEHYDDVSPEVASQLPTVRKLLLMVLGTAQATDGEQAIAIFDMGLKIRKAADVVDIENADFDILTKLCEANQSKLLAFYHAQVMLKLKEAEVKK